MADYWLRMELKGVPETHAALREFGDRVTRRHTRIAMNKGLGILKQEAVNRVPTETKLLKKNMAVRAGTAKDGKVYGMVGTKRRVKKPFTETASGRLRGIGKRRLAQLTTRITRVTVDGVDVPQPKAKPLPKVLYRSPSRYAHLAHSGTKAHSISVKTARALANRLQIFGRRVTVSARAQPFHAQALVAKGRPALQAIIGKLQDGIAVEAQKARQKTSRTKANVSFREVGT